MDLSHIGYEIGMKRYKGVDELKLAKIDWVRVNSYYLFIVLFSFLNSLFLFVFDDDRVTCHARVDVNPGEDIDA